ncbi:MAG: patatin-like phospholipase family protein, partial [Spirochaetia bacterium]|nr:patatin-like phospholipase family protein [Spirochaetia bacterium]
MSRSRSGTAVCLNAAFFGFYCHTGFVRGLQRIGVSPDRVTGSSAGALAGALFCAGVDLDKAAEDLLRLRKSDFWEGGWTWQALKILRHGWRSYSGLLSGRRIREILNRYMGGRMLHELHPPLGVAVSNLTVGSRQLLTHGNVVDAVMGSIAFPMLLELQEIDGEHFLDGGIADPEPIRELILDPHIDRIIVHEIASQNPPPSSRLGMALRSGVSVIEKETRELKELLAQA